MNEQIKLLAEQTGFRDDDGEWHFGDDSDVEKFAELIIKETLQVARAGIEFGNGMEDAVYTYFGVEE